MKVENPAKAAIAVARTALSSGYSRSVPPSIPTYVTFQLYPIPRYTVLLLYIGILPFALLLTSRLSRSIVRYQPQKPRCVVLLVHRKHIT